MIKNRLLPIVISILFLLLTSFIKNNTEESQKDKFIVVLDAGHGGHDPGNLGNGYLEKNIALAIVLKVGELLESDKEIKVLYTRDEDTFVGLEERGEIANKANANLFVSVHCDSHTSDANGAGTFVLGLHANKQNFEVAKKENSVIYLEDNYEQKYAKYDINSPESVIGLTIMQEEFLEQSIQLATLMQDNFTDKLERKDRKVKQAGFVVLHQTFMPSILVETGFLTNKDEGAYLNSVKGQNQMGTAIANAILSYKDGVNANLIELKDASITQNTPVKEEVTKEIKEKVAVTTPPKKEEVITKPSMPEVKTKKEVVKPLETESSAINPPRKEEVAAVIEKPSIPEIKAKTEVTKPQNTETAVVNNVIFKVQLMASAKVIPLVGSNFKGLDQLSKEPIGKLYRYMYGNTSSYSETTLLKSQAIAKGYATAFVVAYKNGIRIPLQQALKSVPKQ